ncbi:hypothetical protein JCM10212_005085 [Sporobolomyces blumeae]
MDPPRALIQSSVFASSGVIVLLALTSASSLIAVSLLVQVSFDFVGPGSAIVLLYCTIVAVGVSLTTYIVVIAVLGTVLLQFLLHCAISLHLLMSRGLARQVIDQDALDDSMRWRPVFVVRQAYVPLPDGPQSDDEKRRNEWEPSTLLSRCSGVNQACATKASAAVPTSTWQLGNQRYLSTGKKHSRHHQDHGSRHPRHNRRHRLRSHSRHHKQGVSSSTESSLSSDASMSEEKVPRRRKKEKRESTNRVVDSAMASSTTQSTLMAPS